MSTQFAAEIRKQMRREHVTIRELAAVMNVTMKRVRDVRTTGKPPAFIAAGSHKWQQDWLDGIAKAKGE